MYPSLSAFVSGDVMVEPQSQIRVRRPFPPRTVAHFVAAVVISMTIGILPEAFIGGPLYGHTWLVPFSPFMCAAAALLGFLAARKLRDRAAIWVWVPGVLWFSWAVFQLVHEGPLPHAVFVFNNLMGPTDKCADSECLYELFYTMPLTCSIAYSVASWLTLRIQAT